MQVKDGKCAFVEIGWCDDVNPETEIPYRHIVEPDIFNTCLLSETLAFDSDITSLGSSRHPEIYKVWLGH